MPAEVLRHLRCPLCAEPLTAPARPAGPAQPAGGPGPLRCARGHSFDQARQGYVNLATGRVAHTGDTTEMVVAREEFLGAGHYDFISTALATAATEAIAATEARVVTEAGATAAEAGAAAEATGAPAAAGRLLAYAPFVVDAGAGTGRHLAAVLDAVPTSAGLALDVSKPALRRAARAHPRAGAASCDTWGPLPLEDGSVSVLLNVFAPRNGAEFRRVLRPDGTLLVVTPAADHLVELVDRLDLLRIEPGKAGRVANSLAGHFELAALGAYRRRLGLTRPQVRTLVGMGPSAWHADPDRLARRLADLPEPIQTTASVRVTAYRPG